MPQAILLHLTMIASHVVGLFLLDEACINNSEYMWLPLDCCSLCVYSHSYLLWIANVCGKVRCACRLLQDKIVKNPDQAAIDGSILRMQSNMDDAIGATNLGGSHETFQFLSKSSGPMDELDGVFNSNLARMGGVKALAAQLAEKAF